MTTTTKPRPAGGQIPVSRPRLPSASKLLPYLERIDRTRIYSNWGPLVEELSARLCTRFSMPPESVVCANSGTSALVAAILATAGRATKERPLAIVPDFTFTATGLAAQLCGYEPVLASCRASSWTFHATDLLAEPNLLERVGVVLPVAPFGRLVRQMPWQSFERRTGIPIVIDGAACFDLLTDRPAVALGTIALALSFHATKSFGSGEGGCVITTGTPLAHRVLQCLNFGFEGSRNTTVASINGKMPEYTAAVALAELDDWDAKHARLLRVFKTYQAEFKAAGIEHRLWGPPDISCTYVLLQCKSSRQADSLREVLAEDGIDSRFWYEDGLIGHDVFKNAPRITVQGQASLNPRTLIGLPNAPDLRVQAVRRVAASVARSLRI